LGLLTTFLSIFKPIQFSVKTQTCFSFLEENSRQVDCNEVLAELETINEELDEIGIILVTTTGKEVAVENGDLILEISVQLFRDSIRQLLFRSETC
jgi:hypothetical protein